MGKFDMEIKDDDKVVNNLIKLYGNTSKKSESQWGLFSDLNPEETQHGIWNEYGTRSATGEERIPPRPFATKSLIEGKSKTKIKKMEKVINDGLGEGLDSSDIAFNVAKYGAELMKNSIDGQRFKKLKPSTINKKGHDTKLVDTGEMYLAIKPRRIK